jgi:Protein of unknown function (DUF3987)
MSVASFSAAPGGRGMTAKYPKMSAAAYHGVAGAFVEILEPHTEADPAAVLLQFLTAAGNTFGCDPHIEVEGDKHPPRIDLVVVGDTSDGRKGVSFGRVRQIFEIADPTWVKDNIAGGLASGEGLIWAVRDKSFKQVAVKGKGGKPTGEYVDELADEGVADKRLLVQEAEFSRVLRAMRREGNVLSSVIRELWDIGDSRSMSKNQPGKTTGAHVSIIAHTTADELRRELTDMDAANGFANRFLWACSRRSKSLPRGGRLVTADLKALADEIELAKSHTLTLKDPLDFDDEAWKLWETRYTQLTTSSPGLSGSILARGAPQVRRLSLIYALLDCTSTIGADHLRAALAAWDYCEASVRYIFGNASGYPDADKALAFITEAGKLGRSGSELRDLWGRNQPTAPILNWLENRGLIHLLKEPTAGKPIERWIATQDYDLNDLDDLSGSEGGT